MARPGPCLQDRAARDHWAAQGCRVAPGLQVRRAHIPRRPAGQRGGPSPGSPSGHPKLFQSVNESTRRRLISARAAVVDALSSQAEKAERFRGLHDRKKVLILPNAWDVPSARVFEDSGFPAVATSSAGMMVSLGYPDGEAIPKVEFMAAVRRIARKVAIPLSVDIVAGFGSTAKEVELTVKGILRAGGIGVNIEDFDHGTKKLHSLEGQVRKLRAIRRLGETTKIPL